MEFFPEKISMAFKIHSTTKCLFIKNYFELRKLKNGQMVFIKKELTDQLKRFCYDRVSPGANSPLIFYWLSNFDAKKPYYLPFMSHWATNNVIHNIHMNKW